LYRIETVCCELCLTDRDVIWDVDTGGSKEACTRWGHTEATWRIRLNRPYTEAMLPFCQITFDKLFSLMSLNIKVQF